MSVGQGSAGNVLAAICSFIIPGLGQLFQGRIGMAIFHFVLCVVLWAFFMGWIVNLVSAGGAAMFDWEEHLKRKKWKEYLKRRKIK